MSQHHSSDSAARQALLFAGLLGACGVMIGAFTAHGLQNWLIDRGMEEVAVRRVEQADVAVRYQLLHAAALLGLAGASRLYSRLRFQVVMWLMIAGALLFSGSLYLLVVLNLPVMGAITPIGGLLWIVAWISVATAGKSAKNSSV